MKYILSIFFILSILGCDLSESELNTFTMEYFGNGNTSGNPPIDKKIYDEEDFFTVPDQGNLEKKKCDFLGWSYDPDNDWFLEPGNTINPYLKDRGKNTIKLYAIWSDEKNLITFDYNFDGIENETVKLDSGDKIFISYEPTSDKSELKDRSSYKEYYFKLSDEIKNDNKILVGWNTKPDGTGKSYYGFNTDYDVNSDIYLYAIWEEVTPGLEFSFLYSYDDDNKIYYDHFKDDTWLLKVNGDNVTSETVNIPSTFKGLKVVEISSFFENNNIKHVIMSDNILTILSMAFSSSSIETIKLSNNLKEINYSAFSSTKLASLVLPDSLEYIGSAAFIYTDNLESITIPSNVSSIGWKAFYNSPTQINDVSIPVGVKNITILAENPPRIFFTNGSDPQLFPSYANAIKVPSSSISSYEAADMWNTYNFIAID